jgi:hypothetical protein
MARPTKADDLLPTLIVHSGAKVNLAGATVAFACAVARMDAEAEVAMADFKAAQAVLYPVSASGARPADETLPKKRRRDLEASAGRRPSAIARSATR